jgi:hypothetical protein
VISVTASLTIRFMLETLKTATPSRLFATCNWLQALCECELVGRSISRRAPVAL